MRFEKIRHKKVYCSICVVLVLLAFLAYKANRKIKQSNWWWNNLRYTSQFTDVHDSVKYDIVNVGSNPARFAFFYENVRGENWSTGTQHLEEDYQILRHYSHHLADSAIVLLPVVAFSSVTGYLCSEDEHEPLSFWMAKKYSLILPDSIVRKMPGYDDLNFEWKNKLPLLFLDGCSQALFSDCQYYNQLDESEQKKQYASMQADAQRWIAECWMKEFDIQQLTPPNHSLKLPDHLQKGREWAINKLWKSINFVKSIGCTPVLVSPPVSKALGYYFTDEVKEIYVESFIREFTDSGIVYIDYMHDPRFTRHDLYTNALFMNLKGRKLFTRQVVSDLIDMGILKPEKVDCSVE